MEKFSIYCSGNASRVLGFYSSIHNRSEYAPEGIFYDGQSLEVFNSLNSWFPYKVLFFDYRKLSKKQLISIHSVTSKKILEFISNNGSDYLICFGDKILKKELIDTYKNKIINFHPSLLPSFKGLRAIDQALNTKVDFLGNSVHFIDEGIDTGGLIIQTVMLREEFDDYEDVLELQFPMFKMVLRDILGFSVSSEELNKEIKHRKKLFLIKSSIDI